jgi:hypothetical protein
VEGNGDGVKKMKLGLRGLREVEIDDGWPPFVVDVTQIYARWSEILAPFLDEKGELPVADRTKVNQEAWTFLRDTFLHSAKFKEAKEVETWGERFEKEVSTAVASNFLKQVADAADELIPFFLPNSAAKQSSAESSEVTFSA